MEMTQYQKDVVRMWDSMRKEYKGEHRCTTVNCKVCPLCECCIRKDGNISFNAEKAIEIVTQWAKEHPIVTNEQKYKEVFGVEPKTRRGNYLCPSNAGWFSVVDCSFPCSECAPKFWQSEYKPPKKEGE